MRRDEDAEIRLFLHVSRVSLLIPELPSLFSLILSIQFNGKVLFLVFLSGPVKI